MKYKVLLWDIDGTVLDFLSAEREAIKKCFKLFNLGEVTDSMLKHYSEINALCWKRLERNEVTKKEALVNRFKEFLNAYNLSVESYHDLNDTYQLSLADTIVFNDDAYNLLIDLKNKGYKQYAVTNGTKRAQERKLKLSKVEDIMDGIFISDCVGFEKPDKRFFEHVFKNIGDSYKDEILIIGDSLTSDIKGANNVGIKCCWYNKSNQINDLNLKIDYQIKSLHEIYKILN